MRERPKVILGGGWVSAERARSSAACKSWLTWESRADTLFPPLPEFDAAHRTLPILIPPLEERSRVVRIDGGNDRDGWRMCLRIMFVVVLRTAIFAVKGTLKNVLNLNYRILYIYFFLVSLLSLGSSGLNIGSGFLWFRALHFKFFF